MSPLGTLRPLADILPEPLLLVRADGALLDANRAFSDTLGWSVSQVPALTQIVASEAGSITTYLRHCAGSRELLPGGLTLRHADGRAIAFRAQGAVFEPASGREPAVVLLRLLLRAKTTTPFVALTDKVNALSAEVVRRKVAEEQAADALRVKDQFLAVLSHELRTPLNAIVGWAKIAMLPSTPGDLLQRALGTVDRNASTLARMVDDLLEVSGAAAGKLRLAMQPVQLPEIVAGVLDSARVSGAAADVVLTADIRPVPPVEGDPQRLQQIVSNILRNALKFTHQGGTVHVRLHEHDGRVQIVVRDSGEGIAPEFLPHVFGWFKQADATTTRRHGGLGIGLALVKELVTAHHGDVRVESPGPGQGTIVTVDLPVLADRAPAGA